MPRLPLRASATACSCTCSGVGDSASASTGRESLVTSPSRMRTMRSEYSSASCGLCVTMMTKRSWLRRFRISMTSTEVSVSSAPVGSSAKMISGSLTMARAMATRCICPPESWLGRLCICSARPTCASAASARARRSALGAPESRSAISTLAMTLWCGMRL